MQPRELGMKGLWETRVDVFTDERGGLSKAFDATAFATFHWRPVWKQVIHSHTARRNTVRGIYVQLPPFTEGKLVTCTRGRMFWVVVDLRRDSLTFGGWEGALLEEADGRSLLIEPGFGHACLSLTDDVDLLLLADNAHSEEMGVGIHWADADIGIDWPLEGDPIISDGHAAYLSFAEFRSQHRGI